MKHEGVKTLSVQITDWATAASAAKLIRETVFVQEQGVPAELEMDSTDSVCRHVVVRTADGVPVATGRLLPDGHIGRVAVMAAWRGQGVGRMVMASLVEEAGRLGHSIVLLNSQVSAVPFYVTLGFEAYGEVFVEAGIPHQAMSCRLAD